MPITLEALRKDAPDLLRQIEEAAAQAAIKQNPLVARVAALNGDAATRLESLLGLVDGAPAGPAGDDALVQKMRGMVEAQIAPVRDRLTAAEEAARSEAKRAADLATQLETLRAEKAERELADKLRATLESAINDVHANLRDHVRAFVGEDVKAKRFASEDAVKEAVKRAAEAFAKVSNATAAPASGATPPADAGADGGAGGNAGAGAGAPANEGAGAGGAGPVGEDFADAGAKTILGENWQDAMWNALGRARPQATA